MKIKFLLSILILFFISTKSFAIPRCEELYNAVYNDEKRDDVNIHTLEKVKTIGIRLDKYWEQVLLKDDVAPDYLGFWKLKTNKDGYFKVGKITEGSLSKQIQVGDVILSINNIDLRDLAKDKDKKKILKKNISNLFDANEKIEFEILRENDDGKNDKIFKVNRYYKNVDKPILNKLRSFNAPYVDFNVRSISIDEKNGSFDASIDTSFQEKLDERHYLTELLWSFLAYKKKYDDKNRLNTFWYETCGFPDHRWDKLNSIDPVHGVKFENLIQEYKHLKNSEYRLNLDLKNFDDDNDNRYYKESSAYIKYTSSSVYKIKNNYNLKTFPFDKQKLNIYLRSHIEPMGNWGYRSFVSNFTQKKALEFKELNQIQGWDVKDINLKYHIYDDPSDFDYYDGVILEIDVERKSGYYIYKIILPILLILIICWSALWIDPKEIESRLTVTIVCLLSLIAYNFVIDSELPKLEYLTIMDYIILTSYIYATIPNLFSVISFRLLKTNPVFLSKLDKYEKRFGLPSYILIVLTIIIVSSSNNPENINGMLAWFN